MRNRGFNMYFVLIMGLLILVVWTSMMNVSQVEYTKGELVADLEQDEVVAAYIQPNRETPTGEVEVVLKDGRHMTLYVTDVSEVEELLTSYEGRGNYPPEKVQEILEAKDRQAAGPTAPACGLTLVKYEFEDL